MKKWMCGVFVALASILSFTPVAHADKTTDEVVILQQRVAAVDDLEVRNVLTHDQAEAQRSHYLKKAEEVTGQPMTRQQLDNWQARAGVIKWASIGWIAAVILGILALGWLFGIYFIAFFASTKAIWELGAYGGSIYLMFFAGANMWLLFPGCLLFIGALFLTFFVHFKDKEKAKNIATAIPLVAAIAWAACAAFHHSAVIGFISVLSLEHWFGFAVMMTPFCISIGFAKDDFMPRATFGSFILMVGGIVLRLVAPPPLVPVQGGAAYWFQPFQTGLLFVGTFVYFLGLLIMSSKWYMRKNDKGLFWALQVVTLLSGIAALYLGTHSDIGMLLGVGGTFFVIWAIEKYLELTWKKDRIAWSLLGLAGVLGSAALLVQAHPEWFIIRF